MTDAQESAMRQIMDIAREHFDASVIVLQGTPVGTDEQGRELCDCASDHQYMYHGGYATCVGLAHMVELHIRERGMRKNEPLP